jgi:serine/threonine-protein kinase
MLEPEAWRVVSPYLDQALEMEEAERAVWLQSLRRENPSIAAQVEALLEEHRELHEKGFLEQAPLLPPSEGAAEGQPVGAYTLVAPIGEGGMGMVWLAERSDGRFQRRVALKFLKIALAGSGGEERFKREGTILGRLTHPHIAQLLDAGVSTSGRPYLVLEHVDGESIDQYCDRRKLEVTARIGLFLEVLAAVAHAHANLIVHRDIKPSNVLVSAEGQVKLLDFGIAKLLEEEGQPGAGTNLTGEAGAGMTLRFAAPEQVTGGVVTTATDVYSLGVMLFVLLTGRHPSGVGPAFELMKSIVEFEPPRVSEAVPANTPDKLARRLRGDLDTIVAKALKKNPQERYISVSEMADDLRRHLNHEPIGARPDTLSYRVAKFVQRNRTATALSALTLVAIVGGILGTAMQARTANRARLTADRRFNQVRQLANKVLGLDGVLRGLPGSTKARHEVVAISQEYLEALRNDAQADPGLALEIGVAYALLARAQGVPVASNLGQYAQAEQSLRKAEELLDAFLRSSPGNRKALATSAEVSLDRMILADSDARPGDAVGHARKSAERMEELLQLGDLQQSELTAATMVFSNLALGHKNMGHFDDSIRHARRAIEISQSLPFAAMHRGAASSILADSLRLSGDLDGAYATIRASQTGFETGKYPNEHSRRSALFSALWREGVLLGGEGGINLGRPAEAIAALQKAFDLIEEWAQKDAEDASSRILFASAGRELGNVLRGRDPARAMQVYDHALKRLGEIKNNSKARRGEAELLAGSAYALRRLHRAAEARGRIDKALQLLRETKDYPAKRIRLGGEVDFVTRALADHHGETGEGERAAALYQELLEMVLATKPEPGNDLRQAVQLSGVYGSLGAAYRRIGRTEEGEAARAQRLQLWRGWQGKLPQNAFVARQLADASR